MSIVLEDTHIHVFILAPPINVAVILVLQCVMDENLRRNKKMCCIGVICIVKGINMERRACSYNITSWTNKVELYHNSIQFRDSFGKCMRVYIFILFKMYI